MRTFTMQKLVRDKILDKIEARNGKVVSRTLSDNEFVSELKRKLSEEIEELNLKDTESAIDELADIQEIINELAKILKISPVKLSKTTREKRKKNGSFKKKIFIETVALQENDKWVKYYEKKFKEIKS